MKTKSLAVSWLGVAVLGMALLVAVAAADDVSVSPTSIVGEQPITVTVTGFDPNNTGTTSAIVYLNGQFWFSCSGPGSCQREVTGPFDPGDYTVEATCCSGNSATTHFTVLTPSFIIDHACITNGMKLIATGIHWFDNGNINLYFDGTVGPYNHHLDSTGRFSFAIPINFLGNGPHIVTASAGGVTTLSQTFVVGSNVCPQAGQGVDVAPDAMITHPGGQTQNFNPNDPVQPGDLIETGQNPVLLLFPDGTTMVLGPNAKLTVDEYVYDPDNSAGDKGHYTFLRGLFQYTSGLIGHDNDKVHVNTAYGSIGIRGTEFICRREPCSTTQEVYLISGELAITPLNTGVTNICDAPVTILFDASTVTTSALTQATYDALVAAVSQTNPVTFASWQIHYFDCTNNNPSADANADPDGDGQNNMAEFLTGTNPTNSASAFRILNVARTNGDFRVTWFTHAGLTNVLQAAPDLSGSYSNVSPNILIAGTTNSDDVVTNYVEVGAATYSAARYYRVRLVP